MLMLMIQSGCASASKKKASENGKDDCPKCRKKADRNR